MRELENLRSLDIFMILYTMSKKYYDDNTIIKKVNIFEYKACNHIFDFFDYISNQNINVRRALIKYYNISFFCNEIEGFVFEKNSKVSKIISPFFNDLYSTSIGVHEYTHALNLDSICILNDNYAYEEILPFLNQFLFLEYINDSYDTNEVIATSKKFMVQKQLFLNIINFMKIVEKVENDEIYKNKFILNKFEEHYKYIIGSLYSLQLYEYYKMDESLFISEYKKLYCKEDKTIEDLLNYYSISLSNIENLILVKSLVKK